MTSKSDKAYAAIYEEIVKNNIESGNFIDEQQLAENFKIGRTPIREAVKRLANEGFLEVLPRKGILVKPITNTLLKDILETRTHIEPYIAGLAAERITPGKVKYLWELYEKLKAIIPEDNHWEMSCLDRDLHKAVAESSNNQVMYDVLEPLSANMQRIWMYTHQLDSHQEKVLLLASQWEIIIKHIEDGNVKGAEAAMYLHITYGQKGIKQNDFHRSR